MEVCDRANRLEEDTEQRISSHDVLMESKRHPVKPKTAWGLYCHEMRHKSAS